jgi:hypothetical protein
VRMIHRGRRLAPVIAAMAMAALMLLPAWSVSVPVVRAAGAADAQAAELVRLINGERAYAGKPALRLDRFLASKARDGAIWCPNDASLVMAGRAKDIALYGPMSHNLRLCSQYSVTAAMKTWGYAGGRGEILAMNSGYGTGSVTYAYGCSPSVADCPGPETSTYNTTAHAMAGWMRSSGHYAVIVGGYDRVGCGGWVSSSGGYYYSCLFSLGGAPISTPKPPSKATSRPVAPAAGEPSDAGAGATPAPTQAPPWPTPSGCAWAVLPDGSPDSWASAAPEQSESVAGRTASMAEPELPQAAKVALAAGGTAAAIALAWPLLGLLRRRRSRSDAAAGDSERPGR